MMHGHSDNRIVLQERDRKLLQALSLLRCIDHVQARTLCGFGSDVRTRARLLKLAKAGYLYRSFVGTIAGGRRAIYSLPDALRSRRIGATLASPGTELFVQHQLAVNDVYLAAHTPQEETGRNTHWQRFTTAVVPGLGLIPDGYFASRDCLPGRGYFLEVDLGTESLTVWKRKIERYLTLARSGQFRPVLAVKTFRVLVVAQTEDRIQAIRHLIARSTDRVFYVATIKNIKERGFWSAVWLPPTGEQRSSLT